MDVIRKPHENKSMIATFSRYLSVNILKNIYKTVFKPNRGYAWKQDLSRLRSMLPYLYLILSVL